MIGADKPTSRLVHDLAIKSAASPVSGTLDRRGGSRPNRHLLDRHDGHRVPPPDALIAAAAQDTGIGVLHYDRHFDRLAEVLNFESVWIALPGSL